MLVVKPYEKTLLWPMRSQTSIGRQQKKQSLRDQMNKMLKQQTSEAQLKVEYALKILFFIIKHNLALDTFEPVVSRIASLGAPSIQRLKVGDSNAKYTSWDTVQEFLTTSDQVDKPVCSEVQTSPADSIMVDEVSDVASHKYCTLPFWASTLPLDTSVKTAILNDVEIVDVTARAITKKIVNQIEDSGLDMKKMSALGAVHCTRRGLHKNIVSTTAPERAVLSILSRGVAL